MAIRNLTPHKVQIFSKSQFLGLEKTNPTAWVADSVEGQAVASFDSEGVARISTQTEDLPGVGGIPMARTTYGEAQGIPEGLAANDLLIVSLAMKSMAAASGHQLAPQMVSPYGVVRSRENGSLVLGAMGLTY